MTGTKTQINVQDVTSEWIRITNQVAQGHLEPKAGVALLQALARANPADHDWLQDEIETIRWQFGLDVTAKIQNNQSSFWDQLLSVVEALLDERLSHQQALDLLARVQDQHPEQSTHITQLMHDLNNSPLRQFLEMD